MTATPHTSSASTTSIWRSLRHRQFRAVWLGGGLYFLGNAMQTMAAAWMMVELTGSSFLAALVQTAVFLPMFLLSLPAGVLADIADRARLMQLALAVQAAAGVLLVLLLLAGWGGAATLLLLTFVCGACTALMSPAWNSTVGDSVPRDELPLAITVVSIAYNAARAVGPALAGAVFALLGGPWIFAITVLTTLVNMRVLRRHPPAPHPPSRLPAERLWGGMLSGLRFAWHSQLILAQLVRTVAYSAAGSALWALLPVIGQRQLGLGAAGYGLLMGCLGGGAVAVGLMIGPLRHRVGLERLLVVGCVVYAAVMAVAAWSHWAPLVYLALVFGGAAWMAVMSTFNTATQTSAPPWVRARALSMHTLCALGSFAIGSAFWGAVSDLLGLPLALSLAALTMLGGLALARPFPLRMGQAQEVTPAPPWEDSLLISEEPSPEAGPVAVEIGYRIRADDAQAFLAAVTQLRAPRRRDGATFWRVYRDLSDLGDLSDPGDRGAPGAPGDPRPTGDAGGSSRFVERFIVTSWADYLHQRARATVADHEQEARVRAYLLPATAVTMQHYIAER